MKKFLKWSLIVVGSIALLLFIAYKILIHQTKSHSPEETVNFQNGELELAVFYNRPYKKGREILEVWNHMVKYGEPAQMKQLLLKQIWI